MTCNDTTVLCCYAPHRPVHLANATMQIRASNAIDDPEKRGPPNIKGLPLEWGDLCHHKGSGP